MDKSTIINLLAALKMAEGRFRDLGKVIEEHGKYDNAGFMFASADRCRAALDAYESAKQQHDFINAD